MKKVSGNFPGYPETFQAILKLSRLSENFPGLHDQPNQVSYNPDHQKIYQEDRYRICIAYFVLFQIILIYVQVLLSITLLEQRSDAVYAIFLGWLC